MRSLIPAVGIVLAVVHVACPDPNACSSDDDCGGSRPFCVDDQCAQCEGDNDCDVNNGERCTDDARCVECIDDADCGIDDRCVDEQCEVNRPGCPECVAHPCLEGVAAGGSSFGTACEVNVDCDDGGFTPAFCTITRGASPAFCTRECGGDVGCAVDATCTAIGDNFGEPINACVPDACLADLVPGQ